MKKLSTYNNGTSSVSDSVPFKHIDIDIYDPFHEKWVEEVNKIAVGVVDSKARDFAIHYFGLSPRSRNIKYAAMTYNIERNTATGYMKRIDALGWIKTYPQNGLAGTATLPRVYQRLVFWTEDFWNSLDTSEPVF